MPEQIIRKINPGDWVWFYREGRLVIGEVRYVHEREMGRSYYEVSTDAGRVSDNQILEVRHG